MTEYFSSHESSDDDDDSEAAPSKEVSVKPLGELLFRQDDKESGNSKTPEKSDRAEKLQEHQTIWQRVVEHPPEAIEHSLRHEDDDDDDEETEKPREKQPEKVPLEHLSHEEERAVLGEYVANRSVELQEERPEIERGSDEDAAAAANAMLLDKIGEKLGDEGTSAEAVVDNAYSEAAEEITELDPEQLPEEPAEEPAAAEAEPPAPAETAAAEEEETAPPTAGAGSGGGTPPPATPPPAAGGSSAPPPGGYGRPFIPPISPAGSPGFGPAPANRVPSPNAAADPNLVTRDQLMYEVRLGQDRGIAAGGLLGYIIGRRRGRVRTEKRLMPVQKKLEKQVETLQKTVAGKEQEIRKLAADKVETVQDAGRRERVIEHIRPQPAALESLAGIPRSGETAVPFPLQAPGPERAPSSAVERARELVKTPEAEEAAPVPKQHIERVERMSREELLRTSEKVVIDGTPLRTIYEAKRITEPGLRHVLAEFLSGGDVKRALDAELTVKQLTYERDPHVRSAMSAGYPAGRAVGDAAAGASAGKTAAAPPDEQQAKHQSSSTPQKTSQAAATEAESDSEKPLPGQQLIVTGWMVLIVILAFVAAVLLVTKG